VLAAPDIDYQWLIGARIRTDGICQRVFNSAGDLVAGKFIVPSFEQIQLLEASEKLWQTQPRMTVRGVLAAAQSNSLPAVAHLAGDVRQSEPDGSWLVDDGTGSFRLQVADGRQLKAGMHVQAFGRCSLATNDSFSLRGVVRRLGGDNGNGLEQLPLLSSVQQIKQMSREDASRGYPVKVRGIITFVWPDAGFFLQDANWSIDVRLNPAAASTVPRIGDYWEVEGNTFVEFAPNIRATHASRIGPGSLPDVVHPNWGQLTDGSLDAQYIEVQGIVSRVEKKSLFLLTWGGRIEVKLPELSTELLEHFEGALVRARGCLIPGRDIVTQQVKLGEFELRNASVAVDEPAPTDVFALPLKHAAGLLLFDAHASPIQRVKLTGTVLQQRDGIIYFLDENVGVRMMPKLAVILHPGTRIQVVGFPDLNGPSPLLRDAVVRAVGTGPLPKAVQLTGDLLENRFDATRVKLDGALMSRRTRGGDQILEMRSGTRIWLARLALTDDLLPPLVVGSELRLTGVYAAQGGGIHEAGGLPAAFELLLNGPADVAILKTPSWWTAGHALLVACGLLAVLLLAFGWISVLHRLVDQRTMELKQEVDDHKRTALELEEKTTMLTREIEERVRMEAEVEHGHKQLLTTSRLAGMAEVATSVLHNVGNVMTNVNVLSAAIVEYVRNSKISSVARLAELLGRNRADLPRFFVEDERGRKLPEYCDRLATHLGDEQNLLLDKVRVLNENIQHINEIVEMQQNYAKVSGVRERLAPEEVVDAAIRMHGQSLERHAIKLTRDFKTVPVLTLDRHKVLQILFNLLENAKHACLQGNPPDKRVVVGLRENLYGFVEISVADNGIGIPRENLKRIFGQGFSTRKDGHGFGLHSSILAAQDMGGGLTASSDGTGQGARFMLEIPVAPPPEKKSKL
jgi:signal transduction histidine kinase